MAVTDGYKYKGEDFVFLVEIETDSGKELIRPFDQTGGSVSMSADEMEVATKDRNGSDYGNTTQTASLEGDIAHGDPFVKEMKKAIRNKKFVKIYEVNKITKEAEYGMYMISTFDREFANGEFATYSLEGALFSDVCSVTLTEIPEGAPAFDGMTCLGVPTNVVGTPTTDSVSLTWGAVEGATSYNIYRNDMLVGTSNTNSYDDTGLEASTKYSYEVSAITNSAEGKKSAPVDISTTA